MDDNGNLNVLVKQTGDPAEQSIQDRFHRDRFAGFPLLAFLAVGGGNLVAPWWSSHRARNNRRDGGAARGAVETGLLHQHCHRSPQPGRVDCRATLTGQHQPQT